MQRLHQAFTANHAYLGARTVLHGAYHRSDAVCQKVSISRGLTCTVEPHAGGRLNLFQAGLQRRKQLGGQRFQEEVTELHSGTSLAEGGRVRNIHQARSLHPSPLVNILPRLR